MTLKEKTFIGIQGGRGSFNEAALNQHITDKEIEGDDIEVIYLYTTIAVLAALSSGEIDMGLFAWRNSIGGLVQESEEALNSYTDEFDVIAEVNLPISHHLMKLPDTPTNEIKKIMAHPQVFAQCSKNLSEKYPKLQQLVGDGDKIDTAKAASMSAAGELDSCTAILGPAILAEIYNLEIIDSNLQDDPNNITHFHLVRKRSAPKKHEQE